MYKLNPLELGIDFENRHYELFDTIDVRLDLKPDDDGDVRKGRVNLVCVEVLSQTHAATPRSGHGTAPGRGNGRANIAPGYGHRSRGRGARGDLHPQQCGVPQGDAAARGRAEHTQGRAAHRAGPPRHFAEAAELQRDANSSWTFKWRLVASVNIVKDRDPKRQRAVKMNLPISPASRRAAPRPRVSTPKRPTGPSR